MYFSLCFEFSSSRYFCACLFNSFVFIQMSLSTEIYLWGDTYAYLDLTLHNVYKYWNSTWHPTSMCQFKKKLNVTLREAFPIYPIKIAL
jgi:hypothetical protein